MLVDIIIEDPRWQDADLAAIAQTAATATLAHLALPAAPYEVSLLACDDARIAALNGDFRAKPTPTNVLSWPAEDLAPPTPGATPNLPRDPELGDIAIAYDTCLREAIDQGKTLADHTTHLIIHGVLHLLGYDHIRDQDATLMEGIEVATLGKLGLRNPYRDNQEALP